MEYNTVREPLILKEYGRNVQKLVNFIHGLEDKEQKNRYAFALIDLMNLHFFAAFKDFCKAFYHFVRPKRQKG